ncbi:MAG: hypothetical protein ACRY3E_00590 [Candidatus Lariskella arthropodorum]
MTKIKSKVFSCDEKTRIVLALLKDENPIFVLSIMAPRNEPEKIKQPIF